jgi:hypothetical protein
MVRCNVLRVHAPCFFNQIALDVRNRPHPNTLKLLLHAPDRPEQVHRRRPGLADEVADLVEFALQVALRFRLGVVHAQRDTQRRGHANRRRAPHHHVADHIRDLLMRLAGHINFFGRQLRLVDEAHALVGPFQGLDHKRV